MDIFNSFLQWLSDKIQDILSLLWHFLMVFFDFIFDKVQSSMLIHHIAGGLYYCKISLIHFHLF